MGNSSVSPSRRRLLRAAASLATGVVFAPLAACRSWWEPHFDVDPFTLGVASGSPRADSVVLWTRLAPEPLAGGGMQPHNVDVRWEVANDESFHDIARKGVAPAMPELAHSVHAEVRGLEPGRWYWYRFMAGNEFSIADVAIWPWYGAVVRGDAYDDAATFLDAASYKHLNRWVAEIGERPAVKRGRLVNRITGDPAEQMRERHSMTDFPEALRG